MAYYVASDGLEQALRAEGFDLPLNVRTVRLIAAAGSAYLLEYDVFVTDEDLIKVGRALQRLGEQQKERG